MWVTRGEGMLEEKKAWKIMTSGLVIKPKKRGEKVYVIADGSSRKFSWVDGRYAVLVDCNGDQAHVGELEAIVEQWLLDNYDDAFRRVKKLRREIKRKDSAKLRLILRDEELRLERLRKLLRALASGDAKIELWTPRMVHNAARKGRLVFL